MSTDVYRHPDGGFVSLKIFHGRFGWSSLLMAIVPIGAAGAQTLLPNDPMEPIADARDAIAGPLSGAILITRDVALLRKTYVEGLGLVMRGPLHQSKETLAAQGQLWAMPPDMSWEVYVLERQGVADAIKIIAVIPERDTPVIRRSFAREETGPYALGFPTSNVEVIDRRMIDRGFRRTLPSVNRYSLQLRDGTPYPITEASYEVADNTRLVVLSRGNGLPQNGTLDPVTGMGGPAYSSLIVENSVAMESFFTEVLDFERRTSREWSNFSPRFRYVTLHARGARTGNLGLVEYAAEDRQAGTGVPPRPPNRGLAGWAFPVRSLSAILHRAKAHGAPVLAGPIIVDDPRFGRVTAASLLAPNGFLVEVFEKLDQ
ncbi:MAG: VOC family protein [Gammaproteobacteria bacterium]